MACPPVRGDYPRALASGLSYVQVDKHGITFFYTTYISVDLAHHELFCAKVGKSDILIMMSCFSLDLTEQSVSRTYGHTSIAKKGTQNQVRFNQLLSEASQGKIIITMDYKPTWHFAQLAPVFAGRTGHAYALCRGSFSEHNHVLSYFMGRP